MAIESTALISRSLEPLENRVEVLIAESRLAHGALDDPHDIEEVQLMTVLVTFDPTPAQRWSARALVGTYITAECQFEQLPLGRDFPAWLIGILNRADPASLCIVFSLPLVYSYETEQQISSLLTTIRNGQTNKLQLAVVVGLKPFVWADCESVDGFVISNDKRVGQSALQVFSMLMALMAPGLSAPIDAEDLRVAFGTALLPATLASGVWLPTQSVFIHATEADKQSIENCRAVAFIPACPLKISSQIELTKAVRQYVENDTDVVLVAPYGMSTESLLVEEIVPVLLLTAPREGKS